MTYNELIDFLTLEANPERLHDNISIQIGDEFYEVDSIKKATEDSEFGDILDPGHIYLKSNY